MNMSMYGIEAHICGVPCAMVLRGSANGYYEAVFERERASLKEIETIQRGARTIEDVPEKLREAVSNLDTGEA